MDRILEMYPAKVDGDLIVSQEYGWACQTDMGMKINYGEKYFKNYVGMKGTEIGRKILSSRYKLILNHIKKNEKIIDIGIGSGEFLEKCPVECWGDDVNRYAQDFLRERGVYYDMGSQKEFGQFKGFCMWDVLAHIDVPELLFRKIPKDRLLFVSIPIFGDILKVRDSKHYKPGEHLYYFTLRAFIEFMFDHGFSLVECENGEILSGREEIYSFVFKKDMPTYSDLLEMYRGIHDTESYGETSAEFIPDILRELAKKSTMKSILDYGCGRSDLLAHCFGDGGRKLYKYDPAIPKYQDMPPAAIDLVLCNDVMEHIYKRDIADTFQNIKTKSNNVFFSISTKPARKRLPNGMNAHVNIMPKDWWMHVIKKHFGQCHFIRDYSVGFVCKTF